MSRIASWVVFTLFVLLTFVVGNPKPGLIGTVGIIGRIFIWLVMTFWLLSGLRDDARWNGRGRK